MTRLELEYRIDFLTAFRVGTGIGIGKLVDDTVARAGPAVGDGLRLPLIPGSSLKGKVRDRCRSIARAVGAATCGARWCKGNLCPLCRLFGSPHTPGSLAFENALLVEDWRRAAKAQPAFALAAVRSGNKIERGTRTVEQELLFSREDAAEGLCFTGSIRGAIEPRAISGFSLPLPFEGWLLVSGLLLVDKIGAGRSRGLGRCQIGLTAVRADHADVTAELPDLLYAEEYGAAGLEYR